jgi:hypothetical protein
MIIKIPDDKQKQLSIIALTLQQTNRADIGGKWKPFQEYFCITDRFFESSFPAIARLLNEKYKAKVE